MLNMQFSMYILGSAACHILYFINKLYTEFSLYLFIWSLSPSSSLHHVKWFYIAMRENEIQRVAFMFWVHLLTCTYTVGLYIFINYTEFGLFISQFFIELTNITVCIKQTV